MKSSLTMMGLAATILSSVFNWGDINIAPEKIQSFLEVVVGVGGLVVVYLGRYRQGDITWYGKKIK